MTDECRTESPWGYVCTEPFGHYGDHVARGTPREGGLPGVLCDQWRNDKHPIIQEEPI